jgi:mRNA turnover protein 4
MNAVSPVDFTVPAGIVYSTGGNIAQGDDVAMAHSLETTVRGLGMPTKLVNGKVWLDQEFAVCKAGKRLDSKQAALLKLFGVAVAEFVVKPSAYWSSATMEVKVVDAIEE